MAFGLRAGSAPAPFMVGLAVLGLLAEFGAQRPLVCVIDDAQWLDERSRQVIAFVGRRLVAEAVLLLIAYETLVMNSLRVLRTSCSQACRAGRLMGSPERMLGRC